LLKILYSKEKKGFEFINVLVKLDEMKISKSSVKAFFKNTLWSL